MLIFLFDVVLLPLASIVIDGDNLKKNSLAIGASNLFHISFRIHQIIFSHALLDGGRMMMDGGLPLSEQRPQWTSCVVVAVGSFLFRRNVGCQLCVMCCFWSANRKIHS